MSIFNNLLAKSQQQFVPAEVIDVLYGDELRTFQFAIKVREYNQPSVRDNSFTIARPLNANIKHIPVIGETVLLIRTSGPGSTSYNGSFNVYYISIVGMQGSIHHNALPGATLNTIKSTSQQSNNYENSSNGNTTTTQEENEEPTLDENFPENPNIKSLQPYLGDVMIEGRFGNSIRLSSTQVATDLFNIQPFWSKDQGNDGDPIIVIRNTNNHIDTGEYNDFTTENLTDDSTDLVITSTQKIDFTPVISIPTVLQNAGIETQFTGNQTLLSSGRIILNSKEKDLTVTAATAIGLATDKFALDSNEATISSNKVKIGSNANEPMVLGNQLKNLMNQLVTAIGNLTVTVTTPTGPGQTLPLVTSPAWGGVQAALNQFDNALSRFAFVAQSNNSNVSSNRNRVTPSVTDSVDPADQEAAEETAQLLRFELVYENTQGIPQEDYDSLTENMIRRVEVIAQKPEVDPIIRNSAETATSENDIIDSIQYTSRTEFYS